MFNNNFKHISIDFNSVGDLPHFDTNRDLARLNQYGSFIVPDILIILYKPNAFLRDLHRAFEPSVPGSLGMFLSLEHLYQVMINLLILGSNITYHSLISQSDSKIAV
jgi:hypothetical protein